MIADMWVGLVMRMTSLLPEVLHTMKLRGWLIGLVSGGRKPANLQVAKGTRLHNIRNIFFGDDVFISANCWVLANCSVTLEDQVMLGPMCIIVAGDHTLENGSYRFGRPARAPIVIGRGTWIGGHSVITKGVVLGRATCVAAGAVVGRSFPDGAIVGGVPAKLIRKVDLEEFPQ